MSESIKLSGQKGKKFYYLRFTEKEMRIKNVERLNNLMTSKSTIVGEPWLKPPCPNTTDEPVSNTCMSEGSRP